MAIVLGVNLVAELPLGHEIDLPAGGINVQVGLVPVEAQAGGGAVDRAAGDHDHVAAGKLRQQLRVLGYLALGGAGHVLVNMDVAGADRDHPHGELGVAGGQHQRMQLVRRQVAQRPGAIPVILAPAMVLLGAEGVALLHRPQPALPVDVRGGGLGLDGVIPFAVQAVAGIPGLRPNQRADLAGLDQFARTCW